MNDVLSAVLVAVIVFLPAGFPAFVLSKENPLPERERSYSPEYLDGRIYPHGDGQVFACSVVEGLMPVMLCKTLRPTSPPMVCIDPGLGEPLDCLVEEPVNPLPKPRPSDL